MGSLETYERYRADNTWSEWKRTDGVGWSDVREAPTTLSGYGITDGVSRDALIGIPLPYPLFAVPSGCLAMNGQRFDTRRYPKLAQKYPSGQLPDLRAEFIRGWDNGRNVDVGRALLSAQGDAIRNITGEISDLMYQNKDVLTGDLTARGAFYRDLSVRDASATATISNTSLVGDRIKFDASRNVPTAPENRPRNIAFHYICLAA
ncbi:tail fiber protein [Haemophilus haemoglobinophilus]|nr:tail fiber protein [Canicola haemoglobinophilus]